MFSFRQFFLKDLTKAQDGIQGGADLMAHIGQELTFCLVGMFRLVFCIGEFFLCLFTCQQQPGLL